MKYRNQLREILDGSEILLSDIKPSEWNELHRHMTTNVSPFPGKFSYDKTPYLRELVDCLSPYHEARVITVMKGAQLGFSTGVIEGGIGWIISQNPGNILFLSGHQQLSEEAMVLKIDQMIDSCGIRHLIRPNVLRKKNSRTGDTNKSKEFPGGSLIAGSASNHSLLAQRSVQYGFIDDYDDVEGSSKTDGSTTSLIEGRFTAYDSKMKLYYISTPRVKATSNIEPLFMKGDQRRYHLPCPCCGEYIPLYWEVDIEGGDGKEKGGITWKLDVKNRLIPESVGYICQKCGDFFDDSDKQELLLKGYWIATAEPTEHGNYSYHISNLYAPPGMIDWERIVRKYLDANPPNGTRNEKEHQTFMNLNLGETYEQQGETPKANDLQKNIRNYGIGIIPDKLSEADGNGKIILVTCACDLNGTVDDARLDWEIVAWSETEASYSVKHGSIGTFIPGENQLKVKPIRDKWTYQHGKANSVWPKLTEILETRWPRESGKPMKIMMIGVDTGHYSQYAYPFIEKGSTFLIGLKGNKENQFRKYGINVPNYTPARERNKLFLVDVNNIKDSMAENIKLKWNQGTDSGQPPWFMNYPTPSDGLYVFNNFFSHYESESKIVESKDGHGIASMWTKKNSAVQNHFWDIRGYNIVLKEILCDRVLKECKVKNGTWGDFVRIVTGKK